VLKKSRLLNEEQLTRALELYRQHSTSLSALVEVLLREGLVTLFQHERLSAGLTSFLVDKYKLLDVIGQGGMGSVFKAEHSVMGRIVALKVLSKAKLNNSAAVARFRREVKAAAALDHPNIITAHDAGEVGGIHYLVMEYVPGRDLNAWGSDFGRLSIPWTCECIRQAALGLEHAHRQGMVHRDIKPGNILVTCDDPKKPPMAKILDLGLARFTRDDEANGADSTIGIKTSIDTNADPSETQDAALTQSNQILGTPDYLAPEQIRETHNVDIRADIFSLGCTMFRLLTGQLPFGGASVVEKLQSRLNPSAPPAISLRSLRPDASPELDAVLAKMLARDPDKRFQTPGDVANALEAFGWNAALEQGIEWSIAADPTADESWFSGQGVSVGSTASVEIAVEGSFADDSGTRVFLASLADAPEEEGEASPRGLRAPPKPVPKPAPPNVAPVAESPRPASVRTEEPWKPRPPRPNSGLRRRRRESPLGMILAAVATTALGIVLVYNAMNTPAQRTAEGARIDPKADLKRDDWAKLPPWKPEARPEGKTDAGKGEASKPETKTETGKTEPKHPLPKEHPKHEHESKSELPKIDPPKTDPPKADPPKTEPKAEPPKEPAKGENPKGEPPAQPTRIVWHPAPADKHLEQIFEGHAGPVTSVSFAPDGKTAVSGSADKTVRLWDVATGEQLQVFEGHTDTVTAVVFLAGGSRVGSASRDQTVRVWDLAKSKELYLLKGHEAPVTHLAAASDTSNMVSGGEDGVRVWSVATRTGRPFAPSGEKFLCVTHGIAGPRAFFGSGNDPLRCYNPATREMSFFIDGVPTVTSAALSRDNRLLVEGLSMGVVSVVDVRPTSPGELLRYAAHDGPVLAVAFAPDMEHVVSAGQDKSVHVRKLDGSTRVSLRGHAGPVHSVSISYAREGTFILSGSEDKTIRLWRLPDARGT
jgi:serine/threonine protein kinase